MGSESLFATQGEQESRFIAKFKENPAFPLGAAMFFGTVAYGLINIRKRKMPLSLYIIHYRVVGQGLAISCFTAGMSVMLARKLYNRYWLGKNFDGSERTQKH